MSVYEQLGLTPIINASGPVTRLGGAPLPDAVLDAFREAARDAVPLEQLQAAASRTIAQATGSEAGLVTAGAAAALTLGAAAILTRFDLGRMESLPHCADFPHEFVIARDQRSGYDHAVRASGARLVEVGFNELVANAGVRRTEVWEYAAAFGPNTAGIYYSWSPTSQPPLEALVECAHRHNLPVLVDAAGELPPRANLQKLIASGADLVAFSGGKAIRGPQSTGILCGRRDLIAAAALQMLDMDDHPELWEPPADFIDRSHLAGVPRHGLGRSMKVSKEEIVALLAALELFRSGAYDRQLAEFREYLQRIARELETCAARCEIVDKHDGETPPVLRIQVDAATLGRNAFEVCRRLRQGQPPIYVGHAALREDRLTIQPFCLHADQVDVFAKRLKEELSPPG